MFGFFHYINEKNDDPEMTGRPLVCTSKIQGRASQLFVMLVQPGKWYFQSQ